ncbi:uncharacterized protein LOC126899618 isoform X2 [Daktulosphaira vitifoliae]|uniref:uncharacterized protein LOC126899618 isoform X2 n=1 Tax=Daktulosphaira vitifoliae TaxID=58002 RepID=UPI0021A9F0C3|nr:uncharacterized protein LOC126899618 isoform X2 [Daktulosphaira vitifoliae]
MNLFYLIPVAVIDLGIALTNHIYRECEENNRKIFNAMLIDCKYQLNKEGINKLKRMYKEFEKNDCITSMDFKQILRILGFKSWKLCDMMRKVNIDINVNQTIELEEFISSMTILIKSAVEELQDHYNKFNNGGDDYLSIDKIRLGLRMVGLLNSKIDAILLSLGIEGDVNINYKSN